MFNVKQVRELVKKRNQSEEDKQREINEKYIAETVTEVFMAFNPKAELAVSFGRSYVIAYDIERPSEKLGPVEKEIFRRLEFVFKKEGFSTRIKDYTSGGPSKPYEGTQLEVSW